MATQPTSTQRRPPADAPRRRPEGVTLARRQARLGYAFVLPAVLLVIALVLFPILWNLALSFQDMLLVELQGFNFFSLDLSLDNYEQVLGGEFFDLLRTTLVYSLGGTTLALLLGLWAALVVRKPFPGRALVRGLLLFPYVVPVVAATLLWRTMLNPQVGILNAWLAGVFGATPTDFLLQPNLEVGLLGLTLTIPAALTAVVLFEGWRSFPFAFLFILARLQAMPADVDEAAMVDGATMLQRFWYVTLPQLKGVFAVLFLLRFIWTFNSFDDIFLLTGGTAGTKVISVKVYEWLFGRSDVGAAAALSIVLALTLSLALAIYFRWFATEERA